MEMEEMENMKEIFLKCANILTDIIDLTKKVEEEKDKEKQKELREQIEEKSGLFMIQMCKLSKLS